MSTVGDQARIILDQLAAKPALLHEILRLIHDGGHDLLAGPWLPLEDDSGDFYYERRSTQGETVALVHRNPNNPAEWRWEVTIGDMPQGNCGMASTARQIATKALTDMGWVAI